MAKRILLLSGLAILAVVASHAAGFGQIAMFLWADRYRSVSVPNWDQLGTPVYYAFLTTRSLGVFAVPSFLFIAGFFSAYTARGSQAASAWKGVRARLKGLLIPYLIWSILIFVGNAIVGKVYSPVEYLWSLLFGRTVCTYYYIPLLCYCTVLAPLIFPSVKRQPVRVLVAAISIQMIVILVTYPKLLGFSGPVLDFLAHVTPSWSPFSWGVPFVLGMTACLHGTQIKDRLAPLKWWLVAATVLLLMVNVFESHIILSRTHSDWVAGSGTLSYHLCAVAALLSFLALEGTWKPDARWLSQLGTQSYGIYLLHYSLIEYAARAIRQVAPQLLAYQPLLVALLFALGLGGPLLLMAAISRSPARRYYRYLFG